MKSYKELCEELNPELVRVRNIPRDNMDSEKHDALQRKIYNLHASGHKTGSEGFMPENSLRAYVPHNNPTPVRVGDKVVNIKTGMLVTLSNELDPYFDQNKHGHLSLSQLENSKENGENSSHHPFRVLVTNKKGKLEKNPNGVLPPLLGHDQESDSWSHIGHPETINDEDFSNITVDTGYPNGIKHDDFYHALLRQWNHMHGKHYEDTPTRERELDKIDKHSLTKKFINFMQKTSYPPYEMRDVRNFGNFRFGNENNIVAKTHGKDLGMLSAIHDSRKNQENGR